MRCDYRIGWAPQSDQSAPAAQGRQLAPGCVLRLLPRWRRPGFLGFVRLPSLKMLEAQTLAVPMSRAILTVANKYEQHDIATNQESLLPAKGPWTGPHFFMQSAGRCVCPPFPGLLVVRETGLSKLWSPGGIRPSTMQPGDQQWSGAATNITSTVAACRKMTSP